MSETKRPHDWRTGTSADAVMVGVPNNGEHAEDVKLTPLRRAVLQALVAADRPLGAYDLLAEIEASTGRRLMPPSVYRALEFLRDHGMVVRIECLNAFLAICQDRSTRADAYFICDHCGATRAVENPALEKLIAHQAATLGFRIGKRVIEMKGVCERCQQDRPMHPALSAQL